jgi:hypothetical protein
VIVLSVTCFCLSPVFVRVDALLWKGLPRATKVQRIGIAIWGLTFLALGTFFTFVQAPELHSPMLAVIGLLVLALGARVTFNAFRRKSKLGQSRSDDGRHV